MEENRENIPKPPEEEIPAGQIWFDRIFLWFILSILLSGLLYNVWGLFELF